jgi:predicted RNase H-like HicB family nuclease
MDYAYRVEWSPEDNEFIGLVAEFPSLSSLAPTRAEAMQGVVGVVEQVAAEMADAQDVERGAGI